MRSMNIDPTNLWKIDQEQEEILQIFIQNPMEILTKLNFLTDIDLDNYRTKYEKDTGETKVSDEAKRTLAWGGSRRKRSKKRFTKKRSYQKKRSSTKKR